LKKNVILDFIAAAAAAAAAVEVVSSTFC